MTATDERSRAGAAAKGVVKRTIWKKIAAIVGIKVGVWFVLAALLLGLIVVAAVGVNKSNEENAAKACAPSGGTGGGAVNVVEVTGASEGLNEKQLRNAQIILGVALGRGFGPIDGPNAAGIGIAAALAESTLYNYANDGTSTLTSRAHGRQLNDAERAVAKQSLDYPHDMVGNNLDSIGLFQQRPMTGWGPPQELIDPAISTAKFFDRMVEVDGWEEMSPWHVAQAVQGSPSSDGGIYKTMYDKANGIVLNLMAGQLGATATQVLANPIASVACTTGAGGVNAGQGIGKFSLNQSQDPTTFGWKVLTTQDDPGLEKWDYRGKTMGFVAKGTLPLWNGLMDELLPHIPGPVLDSAGCWDNRQNVNSPDRKSFHAFGLACDFNAAQNPNGANPASLSGEGVIPAEFATPLAEKYGMVWGGNFPQTKDAMHFEIHVSLDQITASTSTIGNVAVITDGVNVQIPANKDGITGTVVAPNQTAAKAIAAGFSQMGVDYSWGGGDKNGPTVGVRDGGTADRFKDYERVGYDCAGLMLYAYAQAGVSISRDSQNMAFMDVQIPYDQKIPGDMIGSKGHVAMYIGVINGVDMMLEAPQSGSVVKVSPVGNRHYSTVARVWGGLP